jgi:hypothetical protein
MNDRRADDHHDRDRRDRDDRDGRGHHQGDSGSDGRREDRGGSDTRFLQLEMSRVLYTEAEEVTKPALRQLLLEAAKDRLRARFGESITRLAQLAVDELLVDIEASLDVEDQIQRRRDSGDGDARLRAALGRTRSERSPSAAERERGRTPASRKRRR